MLFGFIFGPPSSLKLGRVGEGLSEGAQRVRGYTGAIVLAPPITPRTTPYHAAQRWSFPPTYPEFSSLPIVPPSQRPTNSLITPLGLY